ncbi:hypothetical protein BDR04DRAFT_1164547 [Suillus decipiens]|nr:hypothetical protein BDR04DRAFT_1164547 [Suillus decipiens]
MPSGVSHGPYNQWRECFEFFEISISLSRPDQDFRPTGLDGPSSTVLSICSNKIQ